MRPRASVATAILATTPIIFAFVARAFGSPIAFEMSALATFGAVSLVTQPVAIGFVAYINRSYDAVGSYETAYGWFLGAIALGMIAILFLPRARNAAG